ncbi:DUF2541 family protein [Aeromonas sobria]|uniref:DUF2541 family protein n=1 Tax=Aeromonas sobria TaxID=646 RepID=UPI0020A4B8B2|nr:DUF2541 family protein [Aeromonas sobria]
MFMKLILSRSMSNRALLGSVLLLATTTVHAGGQFTLGRTVLLDGGRVATIPIPACRMTDAIKIKAERDVNIKRMVVTFNNGGKRTINFNREIRENKETEWRSLGSERCVDSIKVYGSSERSTGGIKVFGRN